MSDRTFDSKFALFRASLIVDLILASSRRWSDRISRCRARLFCFTAEDECPDSESSSRDSWPTRPSLCSRTSCRRPCTRNSSSEGLAGIFGVAPNCEYVWNSVSVWHPSLAACVKADLVRYNDREGSPAVQECALVDAVAPIRHLSKPCQKSRLFPSARQQVCSSVFWHHEVAPALAPTRCTPRH